MKELFKKQDNEFEEKFNLFYPCNEPHCSNMRWQGDIHELKSHISKMRQETLQAVREEIEKGKENLFKNCEMCVGCRNDEDCIDNLFPLGKNQALDDLLKSLDI